MRLSVQKRNNLHISVKNDLSTPTYLASDEELGDSAFRNKPRKSRFSGKIE
jgi:hypothetical protein